MAERIVILGAAGRDFHHFNMEYRGDPDRRVVAFTATQIPNIDGRLYPAELAGDGYPDGIPIEREADLEEIVRSRRIDTVVFAYSDVSHDHVMHLAARTVAAGANFELPATPMLESTRPVVAVTAVRTGAGKSPTSRRVLDILGERGLRVGVVRHPMPYGDLGRQRVQRFASYADLAEHDATIEEREEYERYLEAESPVYAGVDYEAVLRMAEQDSDVILWDGGNNDLPFIRPDLHICVVDPLRPGHELGFWPGEANLRAAHVVVVNKLDSAAAEAVDEVLGNVAAANPAATVVRANSPIRLDQPDSIAGKRVLVIEDGPTLTHGGMAFGAGTVAAQQYGAAELIDPRPAAVGTLADVFLAYPHIGAVLPAMGYGEAQITDLRDTILRAEPDVVLVATPIDLARLIGLDVPSVRVFYDLAEVGQPTLSDVLAAVG